MNLDTWQWTLAALGAVLVGISKTGVPGLGFLYVAIFAGIMPAKEASGFVLPLLIMGDVVAVASYRRHAQWRHLRRIFLWVTAGVMIGWLAMSRIDDRQARLLIGGILVGLIVMHVWRKARAKNGGVAEHGAWFAPTIGVLAGFTTLVSNAAGPLMTIYLLAMGLPKLELVGTAAVFFLLLNLFKVPFMAELGLIHPHSLGFNLALAPAVLAGAWLGRWLLPRIRQSVFEGVVLALGALAGLRLLFM